MIRRILIAEDDVHTRSAIQELLAGEGHDVTAVGDGLSAKRALQAGRFDLVCLDVMMPMKSGFDVCKELRVKDRRVPVIFITAKGEEIDKVVGFELGADDYISKPFGSHEMIARVKAVLRRCYPEDDETSDSSTADLGDTPDFRLADLTVQPAKMRACRGDRVIDLSSRELQILISLHRARGDVISRQTLYRQCWSGQRIPSSRTIDQTISQLRKRIEHDPKNPQIILTVYGVGYRCGTDG